MNIEPTHTCFDDALELINERVREDATAVDTLRLVHGIAVGSTSGEPYAHAWVEEQDLCWDAGLVEGQRIYYAVARAEFYAARQIVASTVYTVRDALLENIKSRHLGPWRPEYRALAGAGRRVHGSIPATYTGPKASRDNGQKR